jgi:hypothetical protein
MLKLVVSKVTGSLLKAKRTTAVQTTELEATALTCKAVKTVFYFIL